MFDRPEVVAQAGPVLEAAGVADRCKLVGDSFIEVVPGGSDACLLKAVLHDWDDAEAEVILRNCRRAIEPNGRLLVRERVVGPPNEEPEAKFGGLNMLALTGGRERTRDEFAALFATSGFRLTAVTRTGTPVWVGEGVPV